MKQVLLLALVFCGLSSVRAQEMRFGVKAGLLASSYDSYALHRDKYNGIYDNYYYIGNGAYDNNDHNVGIYAGGLVELPLLDQFKIQPELTLSIVPGDTGYIALNVPVLVKYSFFDKFYAMAGPALNYALDGDDKQFSPSFDLGASYDLIGDRFYAEVRADIGITGYLGSTFNAGVGYRF